MQQKHGEEEKVGILKKEPKSASRSITVISKEGEERTGTPIPVTWEERGVGSGLRGGRGGREEIAAAQQRKRRGELKSSVMACSKGGEKGGNEIFY